MCLFPLTRHSDKGKLRKLGRGDRLYLHEETIIKENKYQTGRVRTNERAC